MSQLFVTLLSVTSVEALGSAQKPPVTLEPVKRTVVRGEPVFFKLMVSAQASGREESDGSIDGVWEYELATGKWDTCDGMNPLNPGRSRVRRSLPSGPERGRETLVVLEWLQCAQVLQAPRFKVRFQAEAGCCVSSRSVEIRRIDGTDADRRARAAGADISKETKSVLAGYSFLNWQSLNRLYEDPVLSLADRSYLGVPADLLNESITQLQQYLRNFPNFPFARSLRLRLATELAIVGRYSEARVQLDKISASSIEPAVVEDAARLGSEIRPLISHAKPDGGTRE